MSSSRLSRWMAVAAATLSFSTAAQTYPSRAVTLIVPFPTGRMDMTARVVAQFLKDELGQPVMVVNKLEGCAVVLKSHGVAVASDTIENVCITLFSLEETATLHWRAAQHGRVEPLSNSEVRGVMTGHRYEEFLSHVWGHYEALNPWHRGP